MARTDGRGWEADVTELRLIRARFLSRMKDWEIEGPGLRRLLGLSPQPAGAAAPPVPVVLTDAVETRVRLLVELAKVLSDQVGHDAVAAWLRVARPELDGSDVLGVLEEGAAGVRRILAGVCGVASSGRLIAADRVIPKPRPLATEACDDTDPAASTAAPALQARFVEYSVHDKDGFAGRHDVYWLIAASVLARLTDGDLHQVEDWELCDELRSVCWTLTGVHGEWGTIRCTFGAMVWFALHACGSALVAFEPHAASAVPTMAPGRNVAWRGSLAALRKLSPEFGDEVSGRRLLVILEREALRRA